MAMKTSLTGAMEIIAHEAIVLTRYRDSKGIWTIGVGHTAGAGAPDPAKFTGTMTVKESIDLFRRDLAKYERRVNAAFKVPLRQHEFDAAVSFDFNTGEIHSATWVKLFNQGRRDEAISAIMNWVKPASLKERRSKEQKLFETGLYTGTGFASLYPADAAGRVQWSKGQRIDLAKHYGRISAEPIKPTEKPAGAQKPVRVPSPVPTSKSQPAKPAGWAAAVFAAIVAAAVAAIAILKD
jgi:lysozyme